MGESPELPANAILPRLLFTLGPKVGDLTPYDIVCHEPSLAPAALLQAVYHQYVGHFDAGANGARPCARRAAATP